jgi:hypothetical protein
LNHNDIPQTKRIKEHVNSKSPITYPWNDKTALNVSDNNTPDNANGHGD